MSMPIFAAAVKYGFSVECEVWKKMVPKENGTISR